MNTLGMWPDHNRLESCQKTECLAFFANYIYKTVQHLLILYQNHLTHSIYLYTCTNTWCRDDDFPRSRKTDGNHGNSNLKRKTDFQAERRGKSSFPTNNCEIYNKSYDNSKTDKISHYFLSLKVSESDTDHLFTPHFDHKCDVSCMLRYTIKICTPRG